MARSLFYSLFTLVFSAVLLRGQDNGFFRQIWLEQGLSQSSITSIAQDDKGFLWFATQDGLNRYDGRRIKKFNYHPFNPASLSSDDISSVILAERGSVWVVSMGTIDEISTATLEVKRLYAADKVKGPRNSIYPLRLFKAEDKVVAFTSLGFYFAQKKDGKIEWTRLSEEKITRTKGGFAVYNVINGPDKSLLIACSHGLCSYNVTTKKFSDYEFILEDGKPLTFSDEVRAVAYGNSQIAFIENNTLRVYSMLSKKMFSFQVADDMQLETVMIDKLGAVWLGTIGSGVYVFNVNDSALSLVSHYMRSAYNSYGLHCDFINCFYETDDNVWIGSRDAGVFQYSRVANSFTLWSDGMRMPSMNFFSITQDSLNNIWASTNTGIVKLNRQTKQHEYIPTSASGSMSQRPIEASYTDSLGRVWVGNTNQLFQLDVKTGKLILKDAELVKGLRQTLYTMTGLDRNTLVIGAQSGLIIYNVETGKKKIIDRLFVGEGEYKFPSTPGLLIEPGKGIWAASHGGLVYYDLKGYNNRLFQNRQTDTTSLLSDITLSVCRGEGGKLLVATTKGLSILESPNDNHFTNYYSAPGLKNNFIYGIVKGTDGRYWLSTNYGITAFDLKTRVFRSYTAADGTFLNEYNSAGYYRTADGELLFGALGGLIGIYPNALSRDTVAPMLVFERAMVNDTVLGAGSDISGFSEFPHDYAELELDFSVLDFGGPYNSKLLYSLSKNEEEKWNEVKSDKSFRISLSRLAAGHYTLKVKAVNADGVSSAPFIYSFEVKPAFWNTAAFYILIVVALALVFIAVYKIRLRARIQRLGEIEQARQEENERVRKAAALDLHDEFGNGLTRISMLVETLKMRVPAEQKDVRNVLDVISENTSRLYNGTKDFIWSINPANDNLYETLIRIKDFGDELFYDSGTDFKAEGLSEDFKNQKHLPVTGRNFVMIFKEALSNTVKHSGANNVRLSIEKEGTRIILSLSDNGKGFDKDSRKQGYGLGNMQQRAQRCGAQLQIDSQSGTGTTLKLIIQQDDSVAKR